MFGIYGTYVFVWHEDFHATALPFRVNLSDAHARDHLRTHTEASEHLRKERGRRAQLAPAVR